MTITKCRNYEMDYAARRQGKTRGAVVFSLNFLVTFFFKRKSDKQKTIGQAAEESGPTGQNAIQKKTSV